LCRAIRPFFVSTGREHAGEAAVVAAVELLDRAFPRVHGPKRREARIILSVMLGEGDRLPEARVWLGPREQVALGEIVADGPALFFFYLFDWSST
jgi:hypothetical protein